MAEAHRNACNRCKILFPSAKEHVAHMHRSTKHHLCLTCNNEKDFKTFDEYKEHCSTDHFGCISCGWPAPSAIGLSQHTMYMHHMCPNCKIYFNTNHEYNGHCQLRAPRSVECVGCDQKFRTLSGAFNHLESSNCPSGVTKENVEGFANEYLGDREVVGFGCPGCGKAYNRVCDLMQHAETPSCKDGYWKGSGTVGQLVEHILARIKTIVPPKDVILHYEEEK